jgi:hypothetical protein
MRINKIENYTPQNNNQPSFGKLIKHYSALKVIAKMSAKDKAEFKEIEQRLSKTKFWDLKILGTGKKIKNFIFEFVNKKDNSVIKNSIFPYDIKDNIIRFYTIAPAGDKYNSMDTVGTLKFKSAQRANAIHEEYATNVAQSSDKHWVLSPLENLKNREIQLNMLEEASLNMGNIETVFTNSKMLSTKNTIGNNIKR